VNVLVHADMTKTGGNRASQGLNGREITDRKQQGND
jgi:hypothetical protein